MTHAIRSSLMVFSAAVLLLGRTTAAWALSTNDILLYVPFEAGTADAKIAAGNPKAVEHGKSKYAEGKIGQGYLSGQSGDELLYDTKDNINIAAGTIALWVKPLEWGERDAFYRFWFRASVTAGGGGKGMDGTTFLWFYKSGGTPLSWYVEQHYRQVSSTYVTGKDVYIPGQWTHIVATWCGPVMRLYVNGQYNGYARTATPTIMKKFAPDMYFGGESWTPVGWTTSSVPDSVIDEVYVLKRPLAAGEVKLLYEKGQDAFTDTGAAPAEPELSVSYLPSDETLKVILMINGRAHGDVAGLSVVFSVQDAEGKMTSVSNVVREVKAVDMSDWLDVKSLPAGKYKVGVVLKSGDASSPPAFADFMKPDKPEWLGNTIGYPTAVPKPWTKVERFRNTLECLNRTITYGDSLFPVQITSLKNKLLARPITLVVRKDGKILPGKDFRVIWGKATPLRVDFSVQGTYENIPVSVEGYMEFDGFIWTKLTIPQVAGASLDGLALEIPLLPEMATLQHGPIKKWAREPKNGKVYAWSCAVGGGSPFVWLGNEEVGLQWATEDFYDWENADRDKTIQLIPGEKECLFRVTMIDHSIPLDRPREYRLAFHPTPVKPMPKDFRSYDMKINGPFWRDMVDNAKMPSVPDWSIAFTAWNLQTLACDWVPGYPAVGPYAWQAIDGLNARGIKPLLYWDVEQLWRGIPEYAAFRAEWYPGNPEALPFETADGSFGAALRTVPSFRDWAVWRLHKSLTDYPWLASRVAGFYMDVAQGFWGAEPRTDSEGNVLTRHEWMGTRELQKRVYVMLQNEWPSLRIMNHQSSDTHMPELAFADLSITGENASLGKEGGYQHTMDMDCCRAELTSAKWGIPVVFLPEFQFSGFSWQKIGGPEGITNSEHLIGLLFVHDVIPYSVNANGMPFASLTAIKDAFGWDEKTEFIGYWRKDNPVKLETAVSPVVVSVYTRPGKALLAIINNSDQDAQVTATVDWKKLRVAVPSELVDAYTVTGVPAGEIDMARCAVGRAGVLEPKTYLKRLTVPVQGGKASFTVKKWNFRILLATER